MPRGRRRFGFGGRRSAPVTSHQLPARKRGRCASCRGYYEKGDIITTLKLKKAYRVLACGHTLKGAKRFHTACAPPDITSAMGYDPTKAGAYVPPTTTAAPPPKPPTHDELALAALLAIEQAVKSRARAVKGIDPVAYKDIADKFKTFQGLKARALRPGTPEEGNVAMKMAMKRALDIVF
jgi:hypothetical protein